MSVAFSESSVATAAGNESAATGDFNGDGKLDFAVSNYGSGSVSVLLGNGDGTFQPHVDYAVGPTPSTVVVGDFNRDGKLDLAVNVQGSSTVAILLGNGRMGIHHHQRHHRLAGDDVSKRRRVPKRYSRQLL